MVSGIVQRRRLLGSGLQIMLEEKLFKPVQGLPLLVKLVIQGLILAVVLSVFEVWLDGQTNAFLAYMPPIGMGFKIAIQYLIQPIVLGFLNIGLIHILYGLKGWQVGFWLNGIFLLLVFSTVNLLLETSFNLPFLPYTAVIDVVLLALPFGVIARFSNGGWKKPIN
jgi:hypothetical protein